MRKQLYLPPRKMGRLAAQVAQEAELIVHSQFWFELIVGHCAVWKPFDLLGESVRHENPYRQRPARAASRRAAGSPR